MNQTWNELLGNSEITNLTELWSRFFDTLVTTWFAQAREDRDT